MKEDNKLRFRLTFFDWLKIPFNNFTIKLERDFIELLFDLADGKISDECFGILQEELKNK